MFGDQSSRNLKCLEINQAGSVADSACKRVTEPQKCGKISQEMKICGITVIEGILFRGEAQNAMQEHCFFVIR